MTVANVGSKWDSGNLVFYNMATGATIFTIDQDGDLEIATAQFMAGQVFTVQYPSFAAADIAKIFFVAPAACELISASERHVTVAGQAGTMQIEKCTAAEAPTAGDAILASAFDLTSTANTTVTKSAVATGTQVLAAGDSLGLKLASGAATSLASASLTCVMKWL